MIRIAAVGDLHFDRLSRNRFAPFLPDLVDKADLLLLAGDLTQIGHPDEMKALVHDLRACPIPIISVLGNHDYHMDMVPQISEMLEDEGIIVLEQNAITLDIGQTKLGIAGAKGFGGGFVGACGSDFGEQSMKEFMRHSRQEARNLEAALKGLDDVDYKIALLHYSPTAQTLSGEKKEIYPFLGCYYLAEAVDYGAADIVFHGHAHGGIEKGQTPGGTPVRNVAQPVIRHPYKIYDLTPKDKVPKREIPSRVRQYDELTHKS